jgi:hypothetical protein
MNVPTKEHNHTDAARDSGNAATASWSRGQGRARRGAGRQQRGAQHGEDDGRTGATRCALSSAWGSKQEVREGRGAGDRRAPESHVHHG